MLILTRRIGEEIVIGADIRVRVVEVRGEQPRIGIAAPHEVPVYREEIYRRLQPPVPASMPPSTPAPAVVPSIVVRRRCPPETM
ncbi:carbon storage regulator CsrA [Pseudoxanthomonas sp. CF125]|uniref:carbon storage regulator CsrA n=1 Tax=Pseudoxanthomonas sp. CF125 TaxID=1855303 RepID=UPI0008885381|nr:carbon storage regulator CsrA [Pseudoxanthomonas sp. CF125]SDR04099.1 carbon storage regulator, CsrA [Pseudoxanthomonas sp. CF125]